MNLLALDLGKKRIGVAVSHGILSEGMATLGYDADSERELFANISKIVREQKVEKVIIGLPLDQDGRETPQSVWSKNLGQRIKSALGLPVEFTEESYSSVQALENIKFSRNKKPKSTHEEAAKIILDQYLNEQ